MPEISVIVPVYKVEKYIHRCIDSILAQTFTDFELILVDDGSPDRCGEICDEYATKDKRIVVIHQENAGVSAARNVGLSAADGQYICFIDSDDVIDSEYCQVLYDMLQQGSYDFSACATQRFSGDEPSVEQGEIVLTTYTNVDFLMGQINRESEIGPWNKLFRRDAIKKIRFREDRRYEDVVFSVDLAINLQNGVIFTTRPLYYYRMQPDSFMSIQAQTHLDAFVEAADALVTAAMTYFPEQLPVCLRYATNYPWGYVDPVYVHRTFSENKRFLNAIQAFIRKYTELYQNCTMFSDIQLHRMRLFAKSRFLYGFNAYSRLFRVYLFRLLGKDAYTDGHGI